MEVGCERDQHEGEPAIVSPAGEHITTLLRGMEDGMRPCSISRGSCSSAMGSEYRVASPVGTG